MYVYVGLQQICVAEYSQTFCQDWQVFLEHTITMKSQYTNKYILKGSTAVMYVYFMTLVKYYRVLLGIGSVSSH